MQRFALILVFLLLVAGCSERLTHMVPDEQPAVPSEERVINDLAQEYDFVEPEVVSAVHSVESHVYIVELDDNVFIKIDYYYLDGQWVYISEQVEL